jgi:hypothetical protein
MVALESYTVHADIRIGVKQSEPEPHRVMLPKPNPPK